MGGTEGRPLPTHPTALDVYEVTYQQRLLPQFCTHLPSGLFSIRGVYLTGVSIDSKYWVALKVVYGQHNESTVLMSTKSFT